MLNLREMAQTNSNIRKLDETKKLPKQPYCVGCENKVDDWDVYVDMREEYASTHATCPHCGLINYEDSKDIGGFMTAPHGSMKFRRASSFFSFAYLDLQH